MKLIVALSAFLLLAPSTASALERNIAGAWLLSFDIGALAPASERESNDLIDYDYAAESTRVGERGDVGVGFGVSRSFGLRLRFDTNLVRKDYETEKIFSGGLDALCNLGDPDLALWRPFIGVGYGKGSSDFTYLIVRGGVDLLAPLSDAPDAAGFLARFMLEGDFGSVDGTYHRRLGPLVSLNLGFAFDLY